MPQISKFDRNKDYYNILNVDKDASFEVIKKSFRSLAVQFHPDKTHGSDAQFKEVNEAYRVVSNKDRRFEYDLARYQVEEREGDSRFRKSNIDFDSVKPQQPKTSFYSPSSKKYTQRKYDFSGFVVNVDTKSMNEHFVHVVNKETEGNHIYLNVDIMAEELGHVENIKLTKYAKCISCKGRGNFGEIYDTCPTCFGTGQALNSRNDCSLCEGHGIIPQNICERCTGAGRIMCHEILKIKIPNLIKEGDILHYKDFGNSGFRNAKSGDLYVKVNEIKVNEKYFTRIDDNLYSNLNLNVETAYIGGIKKILTIHGIKEIRLKPYTRPGKIVTLKGYGINEGNHYIKIHIIKETIKENTLMGLFKKNYMRFR